MSAADAAESMWSVRMIYVLFVLAAAGVFFARGMAYWFDWTPWTLRWIGSGIAMVGLWPVCKVFGAGAMFKAFVAVVAVCAIYIWQDLGIERREREKAAREREEILRK